MEKEDEIKSTTKSELIIGIRYFLFISFFMIHIICNAQWEQRKIITNDNITYPETSKKASVSNTIGITEINVTYHSPAARNRLIFGGLIPYGQVWRAGANESTTISFQDDVIVNDQFLKRGIYGLHMIPDEKEWIIIFSKNYTQWGSFYYDEKEDALRIKVNPVKSEHEEYLRYEFENVNDNSIDLALSWADVKIAFKISIDEIHTTMAVITDELRTLPRFSWKGNREAAFFLWLHDAKLETAQELVNRSIEYEKRFENIYLKALIKKSLGKEDEFENLMEKALLLGNENNFLYTVREALGHHNSPKKCLELLELTSKHFPDSHQVKLLKGRVYGWMGRMNEAKKEFIEALAQANNEKDKLNIKNEMKTFNITI